MNILLSKRLHSLFSHTPLNKQETMKLQGQDMLLVYMAAICTCMVLAQDLRVDPRIAQNIEEGEKLIDQLESLLNDPTIHQQDKVFLHVTVSQF